MTEGMARLRATDPERLGPYRLHGVLGTGRTGTVYLARGAAHRGAGKRTAALRAVRPELLRDRQLRARLRQQAAGPAAAPDSPYVAPLLGCELDGEQPWIATGFVPGLSLATLVETYGPLPEVSVRALGGALARGLAALHAAGGTHQDLRAANVLLTAEGPRLVDHGPPLWGWAGGLDGHGRSDGPDEEHGAGEADAAPGAAGDVFGLGSLLVLAASAREPTAYDGHGELDLTGVPEGLRSALRACLRGAPQERPRAEVLARVLDLSGNGGRAATSWLPEPYLHDIDQHADAARRRVGRLVGRRPFRR